MKTVISFLFLMTLPLFSSYPEEYAQLLSKYVNSSGVDYAKLHQSSDDLRKLEVTAQYYEEGKIPKDREEALSWYLNAYNALMIKAIMDKYPTEGPLSGDLLFFRKKSFIIAGKKMSFDKLEQKIIRPVFQESRIHFALNCASRSCPPLRNEPYSADKLDQQLNEQAYLFINKNPLGLTRSGDTVQISKIYDWYAEDFGGKENLVTWLNYYRTPKLSSNSNVEFLKYDWSLNQQ